MPDLREQLVERFRLLHIRSLQYQEGPESAAADECIRQMEWARAEMKHESQKMLQQQWDGRNMFVNIQGIIHQHDVCVGIPLTAAPDDWSPK